MFILKNMRKGIKKQKTVSIRENYSKGELVKQILTGLAAGGIIVASFALPNLPQIFKLFNAQTAKDRYRIKRAAYSLKNEKLVNIYEKDGIDMVEITEEGRKRILKYKFDDIKITRPKKWDKYWRIIIFDIPEKFKKGRDALSKKLKDMEFYPLQKSVFVCPFECKDEIDFINEIFNTGKFVYYIVAREINNEEFLKRHYNL